MECCGKPGLRRRPRAIPAKGKRGPLPRTQTSRRCDRHSPFSHTLARARACMRVHPCLRSSCHLFAALLIPENPACELLVFPPDGAQHIAQLPCFETEEERRELKLPWDTTNTQQMRVIEEWPKSWEMIKFSAQPDQADFLVRAGFPSHAGPSVLPLSTVVR